MDKRILIKSFSFAIVSMIMTIPVFGANKDLVEDITMVSYEQSSIDYEGIIALRNNSAEEVKYINFRLIYLDMDGNELDYKDFSEYVSIAPGMTKKIKVDAYEQFREYYYYKSEDSTLIPSSYTPFDVKFQLIDYNNNIAGGSGFNLFLIIGGVFFMIIISIALVVLVGILAKKRNRDALLWVVLCFIFTPLVILIVLLCIGKKEENKYI